MKLHTLLILCGAIMTAMMQLRRKKYGMSAWHAMVLTLLVASLGIMGTYLMYYIENLEWGGMSFFGAVLFFPLLLIPVAYVFHMPLGKLLDYATPAGLALLVPYKLNCYLGGCCRGKAIHFSPEGIPVFFPSQLVEMAVAMLLVIILLCIESKGKKNNTMYPMCLILYGSTRYVLNYYRLELYEFIFGLPAGNFWSIISLVIGIGWLLIEQITFQRNQDRAD